MSVSTRTLPVLKWALRLDRIEDDEAAEAAAKAGWLLLVKAQGWSPVGDPSVVRSVADGTYAIIGRLVKYPGLTVAPDATTVVVPR